MSENFWDRINQLKKDKLMVTKLARNSTTIQGAIVNVVVLILMLLRVFGINIDLDEGLITETVLAISAAVSSIMIVVGRIKARTELSGF